MADGLTREQIDDLTAKFLRRRGNKVRRFEQGASAENQAIKNYLGAKGYEVSFSASGFRSQTAKLKKIGARGAPRKLSRRELLAFVDDLRRADRLMPFGNGTREKPNGQG